MKKRFWLWYIIIFSVTLSLSAILLLRIKLNKSSSERQISQKSSDKAIFIPKNAVKINENTFDLGEMKDTSGETVRKIMTIDYPGEHDNNVKGTSTDVLQATTFSCMDLYTQDPGFVHRNHISHPAAFDPSNSSGLNQNDVINIINSSVYKWEGASHFNFLDPPLITAIADSTLDTPNRRNDILFSEIYTNPGEPSSALAITYTYVNLLGQTTESDIAVNDLNRFSITRDITRYDFESIITHELGHVVGLPDIYDLRCITEVMFGNGIPGIFKRNLTIDDETASYSLYFPPMPIPVPPPPNIKIETFEDSYVSGTDVNSNYGSLNVLETSNPPDIISYLKFDLTGIKNQSISKATLNLRVTDPSVSLQTLTQALSAWKEVEITYQNVPVTAFSFSTFTAGLDEVWVEIDITGFINNFKGKLITIRVSSGGNDNLIFFSGNSPADKPYINIIFSGTVSPTPVDGVPGDCEGNDSDVDILDFQQLQRTYNLIPEDNGYIAACNFATGDPRIDLLDFQIQANNFAR